MADRYESLKLKNQICFPLYACSKEVVKAYKPYLDELDLTYTQYITMMVMWGHKEMRVKDVGTLPPAPAIAIPPLLRLLPWTGSQHSVRRRSRSGPVSICGVFLPPAEQPPSDDTHYSKGRSNAHQGSVHRF